MKRNTFSLVTIVFASFALQLCLIGYTFPISELLSSKPFLHSDSPYHEYQIYLAEQFGKQGLLRGYDPFFSAGYVGGITHNFSFRVPALIAAFLAPDTDPFVVYKIYYLLGACAAVVMVPLAAYALGLEMRAVAISGVISILIWWNSDIRGAYNSGLLSSIFCGYAATAFASLFLVTLRRPFRILTSIGVGLIGAFGFLYHPFFPIFAAFTVLSGLLILRREYEIRRAIYHSVVVAAVALSANLFWIVPTVADRQLTDVTSTFSSPVVPLAILLQMFGRTTILNAAIVAGAFYGLMFSRDLKLRQASLVFTIGGVLMMFYSWLAPIIPKLSHLQPHRFLPFGFVVMVPAAAMGIAQMFRDAGDHGIRKRVAVLGLLGMGAFTLNALRETGQEITYASGPRRGLAPPEIQGEGPATTWLREWIQANTSEDARLLFEYTGKDVYDRAYIGSYLGLRTNREFGNYGFAVDSPTGFGHGRLFGKDVAAWTGDELRQLLETYNIGWIITAEDGSKEAFGALSTVRLVAKHRGIHIFQVDSPPGMFQKGTGKIASRAINKLSLDELSGSEVVIRYHFFDCLRATPAVSIQPVSIPGGRYPFIKLVNPPASVTLSCPS
jgi:hypothetical protein